MSDVIRKTSVVMPMRSAEDAPATVVVFMSSGRLLTQTLDGTPIDRMPTAGPASCTSARWPIGSIHRIAR